MKSAATGLLGSTVIAGARAMQRGIADVIEGFVAEAITDELRHDTAVSTHAARGKKSVEDFSVHFRDQDVWVDVKSKNLRGSFSMPNLISIKRLWNIFQSPTESLMFLFVGYTIVDPSVGKIRIDTISCVPAEDMNPEYLQIQNLGLGQLQLKNNACIEELVSQASQGELARKLPDMAAAFHNRQMGKIQREIDFWNLNK